MKTHLWIVDTGYAYAGIVTSKEIITETAPIFRWMVGKPLRQIKKWKNVKKLTYVGPCAETKNLRRSAREIAEEHGIPFEPHPDSQALFDFYTGKRTSIDG